MSSKEEKRAHLDGLRDAIRKLSREELEEWAVAQSVCVNWFVALTGQRPNLGLDPDNCGFLQSEMDAINQTSLKINHILDQRYARFLKENPDADD